MDVLGSVPCRPDRTSSSGGLTHPAFIPLCDQFIPHRHDQLWETFGVFLYHIIVASVAWEHSSLVLREGQDLCVFNSKPACPGLRNYATCTSKVTMHPSRNLLPGDLHATSLRLVVFLPK